MRLKDQDFLSGVMFLLFGVAALATIYFYDKLSMGTAQRPGTGVLPAILAWCLIGTGVLLMVKTVVATSAPLSGWAWRPLIAVTAAVVAFGLLIDDLGLVLTMIIALTLCAVGTAETKWLEYSVFLIIMIVGGVGTFIWLLGMPIPMWPPRMPSFLSFILR